MAFTKLGNDDSAQKEYEWLGDHEVGEAAGQPGDVLPLPRLKKNYDGRAFRLLELTLHNVMEQHMANVSLQKHIDAHVAEGTKLLAANRYGEAEHELAEAASLAPDDPQVHILLAQAYEAEGKHPEAVGELQTALKLDDSAEAHVSLARVYLSMNQTEMARAQGQAALGLEPGNQQALQLMQQIQDGAAAAGKTP
jgi:tetratricopeptide (TPR) repeat protein